MRDFRKYTVWQDSFALVKQVYDLAASLPANEKFGLVTQIGRSAVSIPSNISEGCSRSSEIEFKRFLEIAMGSSFELETQLLLCKDLDFISDSKIDSCIEQLQKIQAGLNALIQKIKTQRS